MRRTLVFLLLAVSACYAETPVAPATDLVVQPSLAVVVAAGSLIGTTNQGELVLIDLGTQTVSLIGDAGVFNGKEMGWTGLAFDDAGNLYTSSRQNIEPGTDGCTGAYIGGSCAHLYRVDVSTGAVLAEVGSVGVKFLSDIDFHDGVLYGSAFLNLTTTCCGGALTIDPTTAAGTWLDATQGYGPSPFANRELQNGAFAIHPGTGVPWG